MTKKQLLKSYLYSGPMTSVTLTVAEEKDDVLFEGSLMSGKTYKLPPEHPSVLTWIAIGYLEETNLATDTDSKKGEK